MSIGGEFLTDLEAAVGGILPGIVLAVLFIILGFFFQIRYRGQAIVQRIRRPVGLFYVSIVLFFMVIISQLYWPAVFRVMYLVSLMVLALAVIWALSIGLFDLFLTRYRKISIPSILRDTSVLIMYSVVIVVLLSQEGVEVTSLVTTSAVFTAIIGFALQDLLSNMISGLAIQIESPFGVGDWVKFDQFEGVVQEINWRATKIKTLREEIVVIPNNAATRTPIINFSEPTTVQRREVSIGLRYEVPPNQVHASLLKAVCAVDGVLKEPAPKVMTVSYDDFSINYRILFYISDLPRREIIEGEVNTRLWYQLKRDGLTIPFPIQDINVRRVSDDLDIRLKEQQVALVTGMLARVPVFEPLSEQERGFLAAQARIQYYAAGEKILVQGRAGACFYIIQEGEVEVYGETEEIGERYLLAVLKETDYFGERSLMTGEPVSATVRALTDCTLQVLDKEAFAEILVQNESLVTAIGERLADRETLAGLAKENVTRESTARSAAADEASLVAKIRHFFQLK